PVATATATGRTAEATTPVANSQVPTWWTRGSRRRTARMPATAGGRVGRHRRRGDAGHWGRGTGDASAALIPHPRYGRPRTMTSVSLSVSHWCDHVPDGMTLAWRHYGINLPSRQGGSSSGYPSAGPRGQVSGRPRLGAGRLPSGYATVGADGGASANGC